MLKYATAAQSNFSIKSFYDCKSVRLSSIKSLLATKRTVQHAVKTQNNWYVQVLLPSELQQTSNFGKNTQNIAAMRADKYYSHCTKVIPVSKRQNTHQNILCITYTHYEQIMYWLFSLTIINKHCVNI